ncbi:MAG: hypothetical protein RR994_02485 [Clostridia bacterium]
MTEHLSRDTLLKLKNGDISMEALTHIGECNICAAHFAELMDDNVLPPPDLDAEILSKIHACPSRNSIFPYALRVCVAASIALAILFSGLIPRLSTIEIRPPKSDAVNTVAANMREFSDKLVNMEVNKHDKKAR